MPLIKRYPNRKLYDTEAKRYVTLDEIAAMVRDERDVRVLDHESGEDVTSLTLTQIILEQEKKSAGFLSSSLLTGLIRSGGSTLEGWRKSVQQGMATLGALGRAPSNALEEHLNRLKDQGKLTYEQAQNLLKLDGLLAELLHSLNMPTQRDLQTLQEQVESLNVRLAELSDSTQTPLDESPAPEPDAAPESAVSSSRPEAEAPPL
ncbi:MAG: polyhydroxyalkanoate synthesis regulator DNA-binding domain-containing protein [Caldilineaceae bacterium]